MDSGRITRSARRGIAVLTLGWLLAMAGAVLAAPAATAAPTATVEIKTLTPPTVSVDAGGTVTFVNSVASYPATATLPVVGSLGGTVYTDISVTFNGSTKGLQPGQSAQYTFPSSTVGAITYTYRVVPATGTPSALVNSLVNGIVSTLPPLPVAAPFVVNTLVPLPNLPSANLPTLPPVTVPNPVPGIPTVPSAPPVTGGTEPTPAPAPTAEAPAPSVDGTEYAYGLPSSTGQLAPLDTSAAAAFDPSRFATGDAASSRGGSTSGGGGVAGNYDGASVPVFGQLAGLDGSLPGSGDGVEVASDSQASSPDPALSVPALAAVVALAGVTAALVRTHLAQRASSRS